MRVLARHLRPGGVAIVDVLLPDAAELSTYDGRAHPGLDPRRIPETGDQVTKLSSARYDAADADDHPHHPVRHRLGRYRRGCAGRRVSTSSASASASELVRDATDAGLEIETLAGDHQVTPFGPGAERIVLISVSV